MKTGPEMLPGDPRSTSEATVAQKSRKKKRQGRFWEPPGDAQGTQNSSKNASKKRSENDTFQKLLFFAIWAHFGPWGVDFHRFWVPKWMPGPSFFGCLLGVAFSHRILMVFVGKKKKHEKWKTRFRLRKTTLSQGSPRSTKHAMRKENALENNIVF